MWKTWLILKHRQQKDVKSGFWKSCKLSSLHWKKAVLAFCDFRIRIFFGFPKMTKYEYHSACPKWQNIITFPRKDQICIQNFRRSLLSTGEKKYKHKEYQCYICALQYAVAGWLFLLNPGWICQETKPKKWKF